MNGAAPELRLPSSVVDKAVAQALAEDLGLGGDVTTEATIPVGTRASGVIAARQAGTIAGVQLAEAAFKTLDPFTQFEVLVGDGSRIEVNGVIARVSGGARALLTAERTALNFLGHLSGIATLTARYVAAVAGTKARIIDTRKTTPGLRALEKFAVRCGGGVNHRFGLFDAVLIKDNHILAAGGIDAALQRARTHAGHMVKVEIEVTTLDEVDDVLQLAPDAILLDNMPLSTLQASVQEVAGRIVTEASGGVNLDTVRAIAETGVDLISVGALTHSAPVLDIGLDFDPLS
ncbi:MAG TPA: carboxylating nicotinate-nucleotide diphosphorylase [Hyphomicrobium sp.]|jgi:nicotinate-nucleotide pyrophosphorylase (carboxylating)